jgi:hypothetical protein
MCLGVLLEGLNILALTQVLLLHFIIDRVLMAWKVQEITIYGIVSLSPIVDGVLKKLYLTLVDQVKHLRIITVKHIWHGKVQEITIYGILIILIRLVGYLRNLQ